MGLGEDKEHGFTQKMLSESAKPGADATVRRPDESSYRVNSALTSGMIAELNGRFTTLTATPVSYC